jgi:uncharacterized delta-60 repeat protein
MKRLSSIALGLAAAGLLAGPALGSPAGDLDPSFDGDGKRSVANPYMANEVLVQPDGKILVVGNGAANDFAVTRLSAEGAIDRGYGNNGTAVADFGEDDRALAAALQPDGKVVLVGESVSMGDTTAVARFDANGKLDAGFDPGGTDGDGKKLLPNGPGDPEAVLVQPDGRIVVAGSRSTGEIVDTEMAVVRLTTTGAVDGTEWDYGRFAARAVTRTAALTPDGKIVLAGELQPDNQPREIELTRFDANGKLDKTFGGTGKATFASDASEEVADVLVQPDGKVVVTGSRSKSGFFEGVVTRVQSDGKPDPTWGRRRPGLRRLRVAELRHGGRAPARRQGRRRGPGGRRGRHGGGPLPPRRIARRELRVRRAQHGPGRLHRGRAGGRTPRRRPHRDGGPVRRRQPGGAAVGRPAACRR